MSTLTVHCQWEDETGRETTDHPPLYDEAKKMKSLTLHAHGCLSSYCSLLRLTPPLFMLWQRQSQAWKMKEGSANRLFDETTSLQSSQPINDQLRISCG